MDFEMIGPALELGLSAIGTLIGCGIPGIASHALMSRVDEGHAKLLRLSAAPGIGECSGNAIMFAAIYQGKASVSAIWLFLENQPSLVKPLSQLV